MVSETFERVKLAYAFNLACIVFKYNDALQAQ